MHYADYKTILSPSNNMNVYRGCTHGCIYCDSRSKCYRMDHDFEDIEVKRNAPQILEAQLKRRRKPAMISTGAMCDPYIPLEEELQVTRRCLEVIERNRFGVALLTKSARIVRDLDPLKRIHEKTKCVVQMTLTTYDESLCKILEPNVSTTRERFEVLQIMREEGIPTVVWISPLLPFLTDTEENLKGILDYCVQAGVKGFVHFGFGMTLREGNREYFYRQLDRNFPGLKQQYIETYGDSYSCGLKNEAALTKIFRDTCNRYDLLCHPKEVFKFLQTFEPKEKQISLWDGMNS